MTRVEPVRDILEDIRIHSRLLAKQFDIVYAYQIDRVPEMARPWVLVVFEADEDRARRVRYPIDEADPTGEIFEYFEFPTPRGEYLPIAVLGFLNAPGYAEYTGSIAYIDC